MKIACIVEGQGEVKALPVLLKRLHTWKTSDLSYPIIEEPIRVKRDRFINKDDEFKRYLQLAAAKCGNEGWILILLDADDDCPADLGATILQRATQYIPYRPISVVLANMEFEAWFIASAESLNGKHGFVFNPKEVIEAERVRNAKGWIKSHMSTNSYGETTEQPAFVREMSLQQAFSNSRSFRKLCSEWEKQMRSHV